jgi:hypothetical protein
MNNCTQPAQGRDEGRKGANIPEIKPVDIIVK